MNKDENDFQKKKRPRTRLPGKVTDNIPENKVLNIPGNVIFKFFEKELVKKFVKYGENTIIDPADNEKPDSDLKK